MTPTQTCPFCGLQSDVIQGPTHRYLVSTPGCWKVYGDVLAREYEDFRFFRLHDLTVDAYALQHPGEPSDQTIRSAVIHLTSLYAYFEEGVPAAKLSRVKQLAARFKSEFTWLDPPETLSGLNCATLLSCEDPGEYETRLIAWADFVYTRWQNHHTTARELYRRLGGV
ncbi:DUF5946 family protein [Spirochaeta lutea]|uniref:Uncharacterized protein n=1 Tax=Spirochaeta lutea TaxID=1480694 RepID=A0A098QTZ6_9SPIO|nr:DUF5946 family protein [Spirochaeta lutea]KGE70833.1 hypothetical protein DC28_15245 [Spirochaeta lutea]